MSGVDILSEDLWYGRRHGASGIEFEELDSCPQEMLTHRERLYIIYLV